MTTFNEFIKSMEASEPPLNMSIPLLALWHDGKGDWHAAHDLVDSREDKTGCWVHAYLHRKEGDASNAQYWYSRAGKSFPLLTIAGEWEYLVKSLINEASTA